jgi:hypothetical protein
MPPMTGRVIAGRYNLQHPIGRGAMGVVWRARDQILDRDVAVKEVLISSLLGEEERRNAYQRTLREARTAARLSHRGLVAVYDVAEEDGRPWIVMELVPSRSLDQVLTVEGRLPPLRVARIGQQLLSALAAAHLAGVLHRDVKPSNVLIATDRTGTGWDERAVLTDFGIAQFEGDPRLTQTGMVMGSPGFTAPERIRGGDATHGSDLWSLGATLYAAVEGRGPYEQRGGAITTMSAIINEDAPIAAHAGRLAQVIAALLRRDPAARPSAPTTARMFAQVLSVLTASEPAPAAGKHPPTVASSLVAAPVVPALSAPTAAPAGPPPTAAAVAEAPAPESSAEPAEEDPPAAEDPPSEEATPAAEETSTDKDTPTGVDDASNAEHEEAAAPAAAAAAQPGSAAKDPEAATPEAEAGTPEAEAGTPQAEALASDSEAEATKPAASTPTPGPQADARATDDAEASADEDADETDVAENATDVAESAAEVVAAVEAVSAIEELEKPDGIEDADVPIPASELVDPVAQAGEDVAGDAEAGEAKAGDAEAGDAAEPEATGAPADASEPVQVGAKQSGAAETVVDEDGAGLRSAENAAPAAHTVTPKPKPKPSPSFTAARPGERGATPTFSAARPGTPTSRPAAPPAAPAAKPAKPASGYGSAQPGYGAARYDASQPGSAQHGATPYGGTSYEGTSYGGPSYGGQQPGATAPYLDQSIEYTPGTGGGRAQRSLRPKSRIVWVIVAVLLAVAVGAGAAILLGHHAPATAAGTGSNPPASAKTRFLTVNALNKPSSAVPAGWTTATLQPSAGKTNAGFMISTPPGWTKQRQGLGTFFHGPNDMLLEVDLTPHKYPSDMVQEAKSIEQEDLASGKFRNYLRAALVAVPIRGTKGAFWQFTWSLNGAAVRTDDILFVLPTSDGAQSYAVYVRGPNSGWGTKELPVFDKILSTFQTVPASS